MKTPAETPALNATFNVYIELKETFIPDDLAEYPTLANIPRGYVIPSGGVQMVRAANTKLIINEEGLKKIAEKKLILSFYGTGVYEDGLLHTKTFKFCRFYDRDEPSQTNVCVQHNNYK